MKATQRGNVQLRISSTGESVSQARLGVVSVAYAIFAKLRMNFVLVPSLFAEIEKQSVYNAFPLSFNGLKGIVFLVVPLVQNQS